jgi:hypothetical protein
MSGDSPVRTLAAVVAVAASVALAVVMTGCGGGHQATSSATAAAKPPSSTSTPATPATTTTATPGAGATTTTATATTGGGASTRSAGPYWPYPKLLARLDGQTVVLSHSTVHLDSGLLECNGNGASVRTGSGRSWKRYTCTQTVFQAGADHDITFDVATVSATQLKISSPRYGPD